jgi:type IV secretion system protein VirD4
MAGRTVSGDDIDILRPEEVRRIPERQALVIAENGRPIIARLHRSIDGRTGRALLADQQRLRRQLTGRPAERLVPADLAATALHEARVRGLTGGPEDYR